MEQQAFMEEVKQLHPFLSVRGQDAQLQLKLY